MSFSLRPIEASDIEIAQSVATTVRAEFPGTDEKPAPGAKPDADGYLCDLEEAAERYLGSRGMFYVMTDRGRIIGTGAIRRFTEDICELRHLYFLRPYRGRGLGEEMLISLLEWSRENDYQAIRLSVTRNQRDAIRLFRKHGFMETGRQNQETGEVVFELDLTKKPRRYL